MWENNNVQSFVIYKRLQTSKYFLCTYNGIK